MEPTNSKDTAPTHTELKTRIDQLRLKIHLGGMDAQDKLDALTHEVTAFSHKVTHASREVAHKLRERIDALEAMLIVRD